MAREARYQELRRQFREADRVGNLRESERLVLEMIDLKPEWRWDYELLANLYERERRVREAFDAWGMVMNWRFNGSWDAQSDACKLTHYGDLALRFHETDTALKAYRAAVVGRRVYDIANPWLRAGESLEHVGAIAHLSSYRENDNHGREREAEQDLKHCVTLAPRQFSYRLEYARFLLLMTRPKEALAEYKAAFELAPAPEREAIRREVREDKHLVDSGWRIVSDHGKPKNVHFVAPWP